MTFDIKAANPRWIAPPTPTILDIHSMPGYEGKLIHLLLGSVKIVHTPSGKLINQKTNLAVLGAPPTSNTKKAFKAALVAQTIGILELNEYLKKNLAQLVFFEELFDEYSRVFYNTQLNRHVQAFLHIYRILERISYAFPIAYASISTDYKGTFNQLKGYLINVKDGELKFFNGFISHNIPAAARVSRVKLDVSTNLIANRPAHFASLKSALDANKIKNQSADQWIEVEYSDIISVIINLRNRYFHFMSGISNNLTGKNLPDPDEFFGSINGVFVNWLTYIYFRIIEAKI